VALVHWTSTAIAFRLVVTKIITKSFERVARQEWRQDYETRCLCRVWLSFLLSFMAFPQAASRFLGKNPFR
jgi:hypothetical protein